MVTHPAERASRRPVNADISSAESAHTGSPDAIARAKGTSSSRLAARQAASSSSSYPVLATISTTFAPPAPVSTTKPASAPTEASACSRQVLLTSSEVVACESDAVTSCSRRVASARAATSVLGATALELLEREPGLVGVASDDRERGRVGLGDDRLPGDREHELARPGDDDRRTQRRPDAELPDEFETFPVRRLKDVGDERRAQIVDCGPQPREVVEAEGPTAELGSRRIDREELEVVLADPPEHAVVGAERRPRFSGDRRDRILGLVRDEARSHLQDALERDARLALDLVQARPLESLRGEVRDDPRQRLRVVVQRVAAVEQEADRADDVLLRPQRQRHGGL